MNMQTYGIVCAAAANKDGVNAAMNLLLGYPETTDNLNAPYSASGEFPATHWAGGWYLGTDSAALEALFLDPAANMPTPFAGWPYNGVSEATAISDVQAARLIRDTADTDAVNLPGAVGQTLNAAMSIQPCSAL